MTMQRLIAMALVVLAPAVAEARSGRTTVTNTAPGITLGATPVDLRAGLPTDLPTNLGDGSSFGTNLGDTGSTPAPAPAPDAGDGASGGADDGSVDSGAPGIVDGGSSLDLANALESTLAALQNDAQSLSDEAADEGDYGDSEALADLVQDASAVAQGVTNVVIVPLDQLAPVPGIRGGFERLSTNFDAISYDLSNLSSVPDVINDEVSSALTLRDQLDAELLASERDRPTRGN